MCLREVLPIEMILFSFAIFKIDMWTYRSTGLSKSSYFLGALAESFSKIYHTSYIPQYCMIEMTKISQCLWWVENKN